jgi:hypothetical protein
VINLRPLLYRAYSLHTALQAVLCYPFLPPPITGTLLHISPVLQYPSADRPITWVCGLQLIAFDSPR